MWPGSQFACRCASRYISTILYIHTHTHIYLLYYTQGQGTGPICNLSYGVLDMGHVFVNTIHQYEVMLENRGSIQAKYHLVPNKSAMGSRLLILLLYYYIIKIILIPGSSSRHRLASSSPASHRSSASRSAAISVGRSSSNSGTTVSVPGRI